MESLSKDLLETMTVEDFQLQKIMEGTGFNCDKTNIGINLRTKMLVKIDHLDTKDDSFDYSENFYGVQVINNIKIYINLKYIVGEEKDQDSLLRETYRFIKGQLKVLQTNKDIFFANILEGDEPSFYMPKFEYLLSLPEFQSVKSNVYVGDLRRYFLWVNSKVEI
jgi:hypothetical protein